MAYGWIDGWISDQWYDGVHIMGYQMINYDKINSQITRRLKQQHSCSRRIKDKN